MKVSTRLNLLSLLIVLAMTALVLGAAVVFLQSDLRQSRERLMQLELQGATQAIRQQLYRSGVRAAAREDCRDSSPHRSLADGERSFALDESRDSDLDAIDIGDRVERPGFAGKRQSESAPANAT